MYQQSNPSATAPLDADVEKYQAFLKGWIIYDKLTPNLYSIYQNTSTGICRSVLAIQTFHVFTHRNLSMAQAFLSSHPDPSTLVTVADKLRYYRFTHELLQMDVANAIHVHRETYSSMENSSRTAAYNLTDMKNLADFYQIPVKNLLDDYNLFLYQNFGMQLRNLRTSFHLKQYELAELLNVNKSAVLSWEHEWHIMPYETYHLLFQTDFLKQHCNS